MATEILPSNPFVQEDVIPQQLAVAELRAHGIKPGIAAVALATEIADDGKLLPDPSIRPYMRKLRAHLGVIEMGYYPEVTRTPAEARAAVHSHQELGHKVIVMLPNDEEVIQSLDPSADIDGLTEAGRLQSYPATSLAVLDYADRVMPGGLAGTDPDRITFVGSGRLVNGPAIQKLQDQWRITPGRVITRDSPPDEIDRLHATSDLVITATGRAGVLQARHLFRQEGDSELPLTVIDAGVGVLKDENGDEIDIGGRFVYGDVDPALYFHDGKESLRLSAAPLVFGSERVHIACGVGGLTVKWLANNALAAIERDSKLPQIPVVRELVAAAA